MEATASAAATGSAEEEKMGGEEANGEDRQWRPSWVGEDSHSGGFRQLGQGDEVSVTGRKKEQRGGHGKGAAIVEITATEREWRRGSSDGWSATEAEERGGRWSQRRWTARQGKGGGVDVGLGEGSRRRNGGEEVDYRTTENGGKDQERQRRCSANGMGSSDGVGSGREEVVVRSRNRREEEEDEACDEGCRQRLRQRLRDLAGAEEEKMGGEEANGEDRQRRPSWVGEDGHSGGFRQLGQGDEASVTGRKKEQRGEGE